MPKSGVRVAGFLVRWISLAGLAFAVFTFINNAQFWLRSASSMGTVIGEASSMSTSIRGGRTIGTSVSFAPKVSFQTATGETVSFLSDVGYGELLKYKRGEEIPVLYLPGDPETAKVNSFFQMFVLPVILFGFCAVFWGIGIVMRAMTEDTPKERRKSRP
jgi:hypothetical protein